MTDALPDRLSLDPRSPYHDAALLERGVGIVFNGVERTNLLQVSDSVRYTWDSAKPLGSRIDVATVMIGGAPLDLARSYRITVNAFLADGGDGFTILKNGTNRTAGGLDLDVFIAYVAANPNLTPPTANRITRR